MITYRNATDDDFDLTFKIKEHATKELVKKIWGWNHAVQIKYHKDQFEPEKTRIILFKNQQAGYICTSRNDNCLYLESIIIFPRFQNQNIGTALLLDLISESRKLDTQLELQVLKANGAAKRLYDKLNFKTFDETELHYKMRHYKTDL